MSAHRLIFIHLFSDMEIEVFKCTPTVLPRPSVAVNDTIAVHKDY